MCFINSHVSFVNVHMEFVRECRSYYFNVLKLVVHRRVDVSFVGCIFYFELC